MEIIVKNQFYDEKENYEDLFYQLIGQKCKNRMFAAFKNHGLFLWFFPLLSVECCYT